MADHKPTGPSGKEPWIWMGGAICPAAEARISVTDHGFLYGDSIYETLRSYGGRPFALEEHLDRLLISASGIDLRIPMTRADLSAAIQVVIDERPGDSEAGVRLTVTRGVGPLGLDITVCENPEVILFGWPIAPGRHPMVESGVPVVVSSIRRNPSNALNPHIKSGNFLNNILAYREAKRHGAYEAILLTVDDHLAEATTSNVFWVKDGVVFSAEDQGILLGVTRRILFELLDENGIESRLGRYPVEDLYDADEAFLTSTLKGVLPIGKIDDERVGDGRPGPVTRRLVDLYEARTAQT